MNNQVSRREILASVAGVRMLPGPRRQDRPPNILFALADDWMWPHASIAGDRVVRTPTFDSIARKGILFTNAFVSAPSCSPSRAAILTGQAHWRLQEGADLFVTLPAKFPVYPDLLEAAGYHVGFTRKGWGPGKDTAGGRTRNPAGPNYKDFDAFLAARRDGKPFCFWFGSTDPHRQYVWESGVKSGMKLEDVAVPPYLPDCETVRKDICDYYWKVQRFDTETGALLKTIEKLGELDNTIVVMSGDNGWPFPRAKATIYDTGTHAPLAISWPEKVKPGRTVDDFVCLSDLAPTFLEAGGLAPRPEMTARSLLAVLTSSKSGSVDPKRDHVIGGMERHVPCRGEARGGYPMRAIRTREFRYIRNFKPDRWPAGDPSGFEVPGTQPYSYQLMARYTLLAFADVDGSPSKAYMLQHRDDPAVKRLYDLAFGKRPARELYDLRKDPWEMHNLAGDPSYAKDLNRLDQQLMAELKSTRDPRVEGRGDIFDSYPFYAPVTAPDAVVRKRQ